MNAVPRLALSIALVAQTITPSPRELVNAARPLVPAEIAAVLTASRQAIAGKSFRLSRATEDALGRGGTEFVMGPDGRPTFIRMNMGYEAGMVSGTIPGSSAPPVTRSWHVDVLVVIEFTGRPARACNGAQTPGEMIVEYRNEGTGWTASASSRPYPGFPPLFEMLNGGRPVESGNVERIGDRRARAFVAPWVPPTPAGAPQLEIVTGDPLPNVPRNPAPNVLTQSLWIDVDSLLPLRWDVVYPANPERDIPAKPYNSLSFRYDPSIDVRSPAGVTPPDCVR